MQIHDKIPIYKTFSKCKQCQNTSVLAEMSEPCLSESLSKSIWHCTKHRILTTYAVQTDRLIQLGTVHKLIPASVVISVLNYFIGILTGPQSRKREDY